jgi:hypothetical protein
MKLSRAHSCDGIVKREWELLPAVSWTLQDPLSTNFHSLQHYCVRCLVSEGISTLTLHPVVFCETLPSNNTALFFSQYNNNCHFITFIYITLQHVSTSVRHYRVIAFARTKGNRFMCYRITCIVPLLLRTGYNAGYVLESGSSSMYINIRNGKGAHWLCPYTFGHTTARHYGPRGADNQTELPQTKDVPAYININKQQYSSYINQEYITKQYSVKLH